MLAELFEVSAPSCFLTEVELPRLSPQSQYIIVSCFILLVSYQETILRPFAQAGHKTPHSQGISIALLPHLCQSMTHIPQQHFPDY